MHLKTKVKIVSLRLILMLYNSESLKFERNVVAVAVGTPYYMIVMTLGDCHDIVLFQEQKVWGSVFLNQVLDIYFATQNKEVKVSQVQIKMLINNTNVFAVSDAGVGSHQFSATVFVPIRVGVILYELTIFSCNGFQKEYDVQHVKTSVDTTEEPQKKLKVYEVDEDMAPERNHSFESMLLQSNFTDGI